MSVVNGQIANQTTFNNAFMSRTANNTQTIAVIALESVALNSGAFVQNLQRAINKAFEGVGATGEADATINNYANQNYISNGDNRKVAVGKLDAQLKSTQDDLDAAEVIIASNTTRITTAEGNITNLQGRMTTAESNIATNTSNIATNTANITSQGTRITNLESNTMTIGGNKTFSGNVVVAGNFEVQGTLTYINTTNLEVEDNNILLNKGGTDGSSLNAGFDIERPSGNAAIRFDNSLTSKFKIGLLTNLYEIVVSGVAQTIAGLKTFTSGIATNTIDESTLNSGVTVDGVLIKDGLVSGRNISNDGTTLDGHTTTLSSYGTRITTAEGDITNLQGRMTTAEGTILSQGTRITTAEGNITNLQGRMTTAEGNITTNTSNIATNTANITSQGTRITSLESGNMTISGTKTFSGNTTFQQAVSIKDLTVTDNLYLNSVVNSQTGSDVQLTGLTAPIVKLTGVGLVSIQGVLAPSASEQIVLINQTGADVTIKEFVGTEANRIRTGLGLDVVLKNNGVAILVYDTTAALWYLTSVATPSSGGGSAGGKKTFTMKLNGLYGGTAAYNGVDGFWVAPSNCQITNIYMYQDTAGSGGTTTLDLKVKPYLSGAFTSIFLTTPKMTNLAGANAWGGAGDTVTGFTAPVLTSLPFAVAAKSAIRMDLIGAQTGSAADVGLIIEYEEI